MSKDPINYEDINTLGRLIEAGYDRVQSVKDEMRRNLIRFLREGEDIFGGILGYERTVIPQIQNAILAKHDIILLGLRGQAKTRIVRQLHELLDEFVPVIPGTELNDHPLAPVSKKARDMVDEMGDETPVDWLHRSERYGEKLATPDTTIADLIGDIDPIKAAHRKLTYADEEVIHFGIIPRTNRGIFAINELPDLQPRIQVGLLNIMEEQDIQIRGFNVRFPLDVLMVFTANPEDYTNRGSIITPLKDRIDSQIHTHYPKTVEIGIEITQQEAWESRRIDDPSLPKVHVPYFFRKINELPDLQPRIQVGLLNIMEEQDIQIRGFNVRFPLDVLMVFTANPEDYTNRGSIITPLKDRIDSQIHTHYPKTVEIGIEITQQEAWESRRIDDQSLPKVHVPYFFRKIIEQIAFEARLSEYVDQKSGVSARMTRAALEDLISAAERRALLNGEKETIVRVGDLMYVEPALTGKIELVYEGEQEGAQNVARMLIGRATRTVFVDFFPDPEDKRGGRERYNKILAWFASGGTVRMKPDLPLQQFVGLLDQVEGLRDLVANHGSPTNAEEQAVMMEFVLEALHQNSLIGKESLEDAQSYTDMMESVLSSIDPFEDFDAGRSDDDDEYEDYDDDPIF